MKIYSEQDLREAFRAGSSYGMNYVSWLSEVKDEDEYIESLNPKQVDEEKISFTYSFLRRKLEWEDFCDLTGINYYATRNGFEIKDNEIFEITESEAKEYDLI